MLRRNASAVKQMFIRNGKGIYKFQNIKCKPTIDLNNHLNWVAYEQTNNKYINDCRLSLLSLSTLVCNTSTNKKNLIIYPNKNLNEPNLTSCITLLYHT